MKIKPSIKQRVINGVKLGVTAGTLMIGIVFIWSIFFEPNYLASLANSIPGISSIN